MKKINSSMLLNMDNLRDLLQCVQQYFAESSILAETCVQSVRLSATQQRIFELRVGTQCMDIDENSLLALNRISSHIAKYCISLEHKRKSCENDLFKILQHFCYKKSVKISKQYVDQIYVQHFFEELFDFHCECIDKTFIREMATNFSEWFAKCIPIYIQTTMLIECVRRSTYSIDWPHNKRYINVDIMAKTGLYFTGTLDRVKCAFCGLNLHEWNSYDNPVLDHWKYSPKCDFLNDPRKTHNVPDDENGAELEKLLSILKISYGYDEID